jgi:hypothetical protein
VTSVRSLATRLAHSGPVARLSDPRLIGAAGAPLLAAAITLWLVIPTLMPGVSSWDTAEFQAVAPVLGTAHPTGYPAYIILGFIATHVLPFGDPAYRMNLLQAILAAAAVAGTVAVVQLLTGRRWIALATGLLLAWSKLFWSLATHADPHMFHLALVTLMFVALIAWEKARTGGVEKPYPEGRWLLAAGGVYAVAVAGFGVRLVAPVWWAVAIWVGFFVLVLAWEAFDRDRAAREARDSIGGSRIGDRWLVVTAFLFGVAVANHSLALLLPPAIALFVLAVDWRVILRWRTVALCAGVLAATIVVLFLELPIRAAMHAPLVYGRPDTWDGFRYVVLAEQFRGSLVDPLANLTVKAGHAVGLIAAWLGPIGYLSVLGLLTSLVRRPRYVLLSGLAAVVTCVFAESYANAAIDRYYLGPLFVAFTWAGLAAADLTALAAWLVARISAFKPDDLRWRRQVALGLELIAAAVLVLSTVGIVPERQQVRSDLHPEGVSEANQTYNDRWMRAVLAPPDMGGLPENSVIVGWWSVSTTLWYGQKVEGLRPDIYIVDDRTRLDDNLGNVWDVYDRFLGKRPVFTIRLDGGVDGMDCLRTVFSMAPYTLPDGSTISQVTGRLKPGPPCQ